MYFIKFILDCYLIFDKNHFDIEICIKSINNIIIIILHSFDILFLHINIL